MSIDVESLYSSIPHHAGLRAIQYFLNTRGTQYLHHSQFVIQLLEFCLTKNYFLFGGRFFHQLRGTAMGSPCAPSYANLLLGWWEASIVFGDHQHPLADKIGLWIRYIDNVFVIWNGNPEEFVTFMQDLNQNEIGLSFYIRNSGTHPVFSGYIHM